MVIAAAEQSGELASGRVAWRGRHRRQACSRSTVRHWSRLACSIRDPRSVYAISFCRVNGNNLCKRGGGVEACQLSPITPDDGQSNQHLDICGPCARCTVWRLLSRRQYARLLVPASDATPKNLTMAHLSRWWRLVLRCPQLREPCERLQGHGREEHPAEQLLAVRWPHGRGPEGESNFSGFHRLHFHYCDGSSYSGDREAPLPSEGKKLLYLRGRRVLAAQLDTALQAGLRDAEEVLFSGGSAGGIGAMHAAKALRAALPHVRRFKVLIVSGFFLERRTGMQQQSSDPNAELQSPSAASSSVATGTGHPTCRRGRGADEKCIPWVHKMRRMCEMHNCTNALLDGDCSRSLHAHEAAMPLRQARGGGRTFAHFLHQLGARLVANGERLAAVRALPMGGLKMHCAASGRPDVAETNLMLRAFIRDMRASGALLRRGNGAFIYSCNEHVAGLSNAAFYGYMVNGWAACARRYMHGGTTTTTRRRRGTRIFHASCCADAKGRKTKDTNASPLAPRVRRELRRVPHEAAAVAGVRV